MHDFSRKVAFITDGGTGIGAEAARQIVLAGGKVVLMGRRKAPLEAIAQNLGLENALIIEVDAASAVDVRAGLQSAKEVLGGVDVLVANAGGHGVGTLLDTDDALWALSTRLNLYAVVS
jgi:NADP-dependent 3-hydroxy acid dehydrogenase YdfG